MSALAVAGLLAVGYAAGMIWGVFVDWSARAYFVRNRTRTRSVLDALWDGTMWPIALLVVFLFAWDRIMHRFGWARAE